MFDQHYTSAELAQLMIDAVPKAFRPKTIADFAAGEGHLIAPATRRWPSATLVLNDLSSKNSRHLEASYPRSVVSCADFLSDRSVRSSKLAAFAGKVDLILINPPFSQKPTLKVEFDLLGAPISGGSAASFLARAFTFLSPQGMLLAVLPDGCLASERDRELWWRLDQIATVEHLRDNSRSAFSSVAARTSIVRIRNGVGQAPARGPAPQLGTPHNVTLIRGQHQMHTDSRHPQMNKHPLIHTTELREGRVENSRRRAWKSAVTGPALLFPRVGRATPDKLCILEAGRTVSLSDCVLALPCITVEDAKTKRERIVRGWSRFAAQYRGTGAPYLTKARALAVLAELLSTPRSSSADSCAYEGEKAVQA